MGDEDTTLRGRRLVPQIIVGVWLPLCFAFASINQEFLPEKYFADSKHIEGLALVATGPSPESFVTTAWIYQTLQAFEYPMVTQLVTLALFFATAFCCASWLEVSRFGALEVVLFCFCGVEAARYLAQFSKESIVVLVVLGLVVMPRRALGDVLFLALACGYAYTIRNYWFIVAVLYLAFRLLLRLRKPSRIPIFVVVALLCLAFGTDMVLGLNLNSFREAVAQTNSLYAQTAIQHYIPVTGPLGVAANALCTLVLLVIPLPLALSSAPVYLAFAGLMTVLWINLFFVVHKGMRKSWFVPDVQLSRAVSLLLAMLIVQAIFEPDYGSYIKHLTPLLPLFFFALRVRRQNQSATAPVKTRQDVLGLVGG
jgi:hypothetical protein